MKHVKHVKHVKHWQDAASALLALWLIVSPWALGFEAVTVATVVTAAAGALLLASSIGAMAVPGAWEEWLDALVGAGLMMAPMLLGFDGVDAATLNALLAGAAVVVLALWVLATDDDFAAGWQRLD